MLWARRPEALTSFAGPGVETASTPAELAAAVDLIGICVWDDNAVREVVCGPDGVLAGSRPGTVIAIHSTVHPNTCHELDDAATNLGVVVVDAPVSGGRQVALSGRLVVAVGADEDTFDRCRPVFESFGDPVINLGPVGTGQFAKLVNNALLAAHLALANDALALAPSLGMRPDALVQLLRHGSGRSYALDVAVASRASGAIRERTAVPLRKDVDCLNAVLCGSDAAVLTFAAGVGVRRLADAGRWTW
jgi:3-hydroxyisobutyrate dehydrogenase-like beta-hydroxyacid dehydrogenase